MAHQICFIVSLLALATLHGMDAMVDYVVENLAGGTPGGIAFDNQLGVEYTRQQMEMASEFIWDLFQQNDPQADKRNYIQQVSLIVVRDLPPPISSATSNNEIHVGEKHIQAFCGEELKREFNILGNNEIHVNANYLGNYAGDVKTEFTGALYHVMTHIWQWNGNRQTPGGLIFEGIADFMRLKANYPSHWVQPGQGDSWDQRSDVTARFLDYCNSLKHGFVAELNNKMMRTGYSADYFVELLGKTVDQLWSDYKAKYGN